MAIDLTQIENLMDVKDQLVFFDRSGNKFVQKQFGYHQKLNDTVFFYTNGRMMTEKDQNKYLTPEGKGELPRINIKEIKNEVSKDLGENVENLGIIRDKDNSDSFQPKKSKIDIVDKKIIDNSESNIIQNNMEDQNLDKIRSKIKKTINLMGVDEKLSIEVNIKTLDKNTYGMLNIMVDDMPEGLIEDILLEEAIHEFKNKAYSKIIKK